jgi:hypothetical protein
MAAVAMDALTWKGKLPNQLVSSSTTVGKSDYILTKVRLIQSTPIILLENPYKSFRRLSQFFFRNSFLKLRIAGPPVTGHAKIHCPLTLPCVLYAFLQWFAK